MTDRPGHIDFEQVNRAALAALPALLARWLPDGKWLAGEYVACNPRRADRRPGSFKIAINLGPRHQTWRRVGERDGRYYLDLGCERWRAVEIGPDGWQVIDDVPVKFLRSNGMRALPEPEPGELIESLRGFVNVESTSDFHLLVAWLIAALRPSGPFPILILIGEQGSAKSTLARVCRLLIDPNASPIRSVPRDERDLLVSAFNGWTLIYDNLSRVEPWLSDAFCRLSRLCGIAGARLAVGRFPATAAAAGAQLRRVASLLVFGALKARFGGEPPKMMVDR